MEEGICFCGGERIRIKEDLEEVVNFKMGFEGCWSVLGIDA